MAGRYLTFMIVPDDQADPKQYRMTVWFYRTLLAFIGLVLVAPIAYVIIYFNVVSLAADAGRLAEENESLRRYQYKVQILEQSLLETRQLMADVASMAGLDSVLLADLYGEDETFTESHTQTRPGSISRSLPPSSPIPDGLPAIGWITRGYSEIQGKRHEGVDLAMAVGSPVYSTAFGEVIFAGERDDFGKTVIIKNDSIETLYAHGSALLVQVGDTVFAGQRIALSGNTGQSSAPHLHYEIRINGKAVNPIKYFAYED